MQHADPTPSVLSVKNPFTGEVDRTYKLCSADELVQRMGRLRHIQKTWSQVPVVARIERVMQALNYFQTHADLIAQDISRQMGRPVHQARGEISGLLERGRYMCQIAEDALATEHLEAKNGFQRSIHHVPHGVVYVISAWNYPLMITINSVVPALIAGNTVVLKHAAQTTEIGQHFARAFAPIHTQPVLDAIVIPHALSETLIRRSLVDHVVFTGSVSAGQTILTQCADSVIAPNLELGGKDGVYVDKTADLQLAVETVVDGACFNSGQSCCGIERAYVHYSIYEDFLKSAATLMQHYTLGDPQAEDTTLGPLAKAENAQIMMDQVTQAIAAGARCLAGGNVRKIAAGTFFEPTLLADVPTEASVLTEENFGPILAVLPVNDMAEAITQINTSDLGLTAAIFTRDIQQAEQFFNAVEAGTIFMNRCDYLDPALPWTGFKKSGCGSALSQYGFYSVTQRKAKHFKLP